MKAYDAVVIIDLANGEDKVVEALEFVEKVITDLGGSITNIEKWGRKIFAYQIKRRTEGFYALVKFNLAPENISKFRGKLRLYEPVLREMTLTEQVYFPPPVFSQPVGAGEVEQAEAPKADAPVEETKEEAPAQEAPVEETQEAAAEAENEEVSAEEASEEETKA